MPSASPAPTPAPARRALEKERQTSPHRRRRPLDEVIDTIAPCPWTTRRQALGGAYTLRKESLASSATPLYTSEERRRRDNSPWTVVQAVLAPLQFVVFLVSLWLVISYLATGVGYQAAALSVVVKTCFLYAIMITGSIWEKDVFGKWLFAPAFFWEDVVSMLVLALHTAYLVGLWLGWGAGPLMWLALAAYATYVVNAAQFLIKLRAARLQKPQADEALSSSPNMQGAARA